MDTHTGTNTFNVSSAELNDFLREIYLTVGTDNLESRDACISVMYAIQDFYSEHGVNWVEPTQAEFDAYPPDDDETDDSFDDELDPEY
jgi:microcystin degradation protein MlrC